MDLETIATMGDFDFTFLYDSFDRSRFLKGIYYTVLISVSCIAISVSLGMAGAIRLAYGTRIERWLIGGFVSLFRNTPPLIQIYLFFFGFGAIVSNATDNSIVIPAVAWAVIAVSIYITAFNIEAFRAAIEGIPKELMEGAASLRLPRTAVLWKIVVPLGVRGALPSVGNNLVELVKSTSYAYAIAVPELLYASSQIWADSLNVVEMMFAMLAVYMVLIGAVVLCTQTLERRLALPGYGG